MRRICSYALPNHPIPRNNATTAPVRSDSLAARSEFELPVGVSKLSYDSIMLGFAIETGCEALLPRTAFLARFSFCRWKRRSQNGAASLWNPASESVAVWRMPEKVPLNVATVAPNRHWCFGRSRQLISASQINTTLSSESLETGTCGSNSLRSANESGCRGMRYPESLASERAPVSEGGITGG